MSINKLKTIILTITIAITGTFSLPLPTFAKECPPGSLRDSYETNIAECNTHHGCYSEEEQYSIMIIAITVIAIGIISIILTIIGAIRYLIYRKKDKLKAKNSKKLAIITLVIVVVVFIIVLSSGSILKIVLSLDYTLRNTFPDIFPVRPCE